MSTPPIPIERHAMEPPRRTATPADDAGDDRAADAPRASVEERRRDAYRLGE